MNNSTPTTESTHFQQDLIEKVETSPPMRELLERLEAAENSSVAITEAAGSLPALAAAAVCRRLERPVLYLASDVRTAERRRDDLRTLLGHDRVQLLPAREPIPYDPLHQSQRLDERTAAYEALINRDFDVLIATPASVVERHESLKAKSQRTLALGTGDEIDREALALMLEESGLRREVRAEEPGQYAVRGAVLDVYPFSSEEPFRLELWGDEISEIRRYDPQTQRSLENLEQVHFYAGDNKEKNGRLGLWELMPLRTVTFIDELDLLQANLERQWEEIEYQFEKRVELEKDRHTPRPGERYHSVESVLTHVQRKRTILLLGTGAAPREDAISFGARSHDAFLGNLDQLANSLVSYRRDEVETFLLCDRESQVNRLRELLMERADEAVAPRIGVLPLHEGFVWPAAGLAVLTDHQIFGRHKRTRPFRRRRKAPDMRAFEEIKPGDFVVHTEFGIGRYAGLKTIPVGKVERECLQVNYQDGVKVYVRLDQFSKLQKYQGTESGPPRLSRIGGSEWARARGKAKKAVEELARQILQIYAKRQVEGGHAFNGDTPWQREMEAAFEFEDTPDQAVAASEVKKDMEKRVAMDRLLVGDVGFGKTEVAVRAVFKAIQDSKQVAVLVPTTILAQQHYATFKERLERYPIRIEVMSRFRSRKEQKATVEALKDGSVDLVIGTHRLLSKDIVFQDLGLLIVDEEHRFGVKHKERLRQLRATVDVLSMSATPIPRTLHMALSGARDMSMISTPPQDRLPIETEVLPFDERTIREAILREIGRGGQVYFVHNRVQTIHNIQRMLQRLLPEVSTAVAHGQMKEHELETVMNDFLHEKYQVLVCTMIIESGLDIPNVNTLLVNRADRFGLAQLYQLRGRIGRSHRQAYAYLLTPPRMVLQADARRRLETIAENTRLGSGFQIAMRDLEIRGAGNLLGAEQSGFINTVGLELYTQMLSEAVQTLQDQGVAELPDTAMQPAINRDVKVEVPQDAMLPTDYVPDAPERVELYRRLSRSTLPGEVDSLREELIDRFGPLPEEARALLNIVEAQAWGRRGGLEKIRLDPDKAFFTFHDDYGSDDIEAQLGALLAVTEELPVEMGGAGPLMLKLSLTGEEDWNGRWQSTLELLASLPPELRETASEEQVR